jgi:hypothetical protein
MGEGQNICGAEGPEGFQGTPLIANQIKCFTDREAPAHAIYYEENEASKGKIRGRSERGVERRGISCSMEGGERARLEQKLWCGVHMICVYSAPIDMWQLD